MIIFGFSHGLSALRKSDAGLTLNVACDAGLFVKTNPRINKPVHDNNNKIDNHKSKGVTKYRTGDQRIIPGSYSRN